MSMAAPFKVYEISYIFTRIEQNTVNEGPVESSLFTNNSVTGHIKIKFDRASVNEMLYKSNPVYNKLSALHELHAVVPSMHFVCSDKHFEFKNFKIRSRQTPSENVSYATIDYTADDLAISRETGP